MYLAVSQPLYVQKGKIFKINHAPLYLKLERFFLNSSIYKVMLDYIDLRFINWFTLPYVVK